MWSWCYLSFNFKVSATFFLNSFRHIKDLRKSRQCAWGRIHILLQGTFDKVFNTEDGIFEFVLHVLGWYSLQIKCSNIIHILCMLSCRAVCSLKGDAVLSASWLLACRVKDLVVGGSEFPSNSILNCVKLLSIYGLDNLHVYFALLNELWISLLSPYVIGNESSCGLDWTELVAGVHSWSCHTVSALVNATP